MSLKARKGVRTKDMIKLINYHNLNLDLGLSLRLVVRNRNILKLTYIKEGILYK